MRGLCPFCGKRLVVEGFGRVRIETKVELIAPAEIEPRAAERIVAQLGGGMPLGEIGGMRGYAAMAALKPDFFLHSGDTVYADNPIQETMEVPGEPTWRNLVTEEDAEQWEGRS